MKFRLLGGSHTENGVTVSADPNKDTFVFSDIDLEKECPTRFQRTFEDTRPPEKKSIPSHYKPGETVEIEIDWNKIQEVSSTPEPEQVVPVVQDKPSKRAKKVVESKPEPTRRRGG